MRITSRQRVTELLTVRWCCLHGQLVDVGSQYRQSWSAAAQQPCPLAHAASLPPTVHPMVLCLWNCLVASHLL